MTGSGAAVYPMGQMARAAWPAQGLTRLGLAVDLLDLYLALRLHFGHRHWWPGDGPFEIAVGAILTQNTAWTNVERALSALRGAGVRSWEDLLALPEGALEALVRPTGYFNQKAARLRAFGRTVVEGCGGDVSALWRGKDIPSARRTLLSIEGIGPETCDSILLYVGGLPVFVVDAYTRRALARLGYKGPSGYEDLQAFLTSQLPEDVPLFNDFHAQFVELGKTYCRARPSCGGCPMAGACPRVGVEGER